MNCIATPHHIQINQPVPILKLWLQAVCEPKNVKQFRRAIISFVANLIWYAHFKNLKFV